MVTTTTVPRVAEGVRKTGRRVNPEIEPRNNTVCFMLGEGEKLSVDRLGFCMNITRSGLLARIVVDFVAATENSKNGRMAEKRLLEYLAECRAAVKKRGALAAETVQPPKGEGLA